MESGLGWHRCRRHLVRLVLGLGLWLGSELGLGWHRRRRHLVRVRVSESIRVRVGESNQGYGTVQVEGKDTGSVRVRVRVGVGWYTGKGGGIAIGGTWRLQANAANVERVGE